MWEFKTKNRTFVSMSMLGALLAALSVLVPCSFMVVGVAAAGPKIETSSGSMLFVVGEGDNVSVSYVNATTGTAGAPIPLASWNDVLSATQGVSSTLSTNITVLLSAHNAAFSAQIADLSQMLASTQAAASTQAVSFTASLSQMLASTQAAASSQAISFATQLSEQNTSCSRQIASLSQQLAQDSSRAVNADLSFSISTSALSTSVTSSLSQVSASLAVNLQTTGSALSTSIVASASQLSAALGSSQSTLSFTLSSSFTSLSSAIITSANSQAQQQSASSSSLSTAIATSTGSLASSLTASMSSATAPISATLASLAIASNTSLVSLDSRLTGLVSRARVDLATNITLVSQANTAVLVSSSSATASLLTGQTGVLSTALAAVAQETSRASGAEQLVAASVNNETLRALAAEASISTALGQEISRAKSAEASLNVSLSVLYGFAGTCKVLQSTNPSAPSGLYDLVLPGSSTTSKVYCDMTTLGGGWTLIAQTVALVSAVQDGSGGVRNLYNFRTGGGLYWMSPRGANNWAFPNAAAIAQRSTTMMIARWQTPASGLGDISTADAGAYFSIPNPSAVTFANPSYLFTGSSTAATGACVPVTVTSIKSGACASGCTRYTFVNSLGTTWTDSFPTSIGVSSSSSCVNDVTGGPALASDDTGTGNSNPNAFQYGKTTAAGGAPYYWHYGLWDAASTGYAGLGTVWLR